MNNLKGELKDLYVKNGYRLDFDLMWLWINQNYISKQQILNLECLKEESLLPFIGDKKWAIYSEKSGKNQLRNEIIDEIKKL